MFLYFLCFYCIIACFQIFKVFFPEFSKRFGFFEVNSVTTLKFFFRNSKCLWVLPQLLCSDYGVQVDTLELLQKQYTFGDISRVFHSSLTFKKLISEIVHVCWKYFLGFLYSIFRKDSVEHQYRFKSCLLPWSFGISINPFETFETFHSSLVES